MQERRLLTLRLPKALLQVILERRGKRRNASQLLRAKMAPDSKSAIAPHDPIATLMRHASARRPRLPKLATSSLNRRPRNLLPRLQRNHRPHRSLQRLPRLPSLLRHQRPPSQPKQRPGMRSANPAAIVRSAARISQAPLRKQARHLQTPFRHRRHPRPTHPRQRTARQRLRLLQPRLPSPRHRAPPRPR